MMPLSDFAEKIRASDAIVVFTGAGISTESGIPDFRSPGGIWTRYRPVTYQEYMTSESARIEAWKRRLDGWEQYKNAKPNIGHYFVHSLDAKGKLIGLITQNVDGLHAEAGLADEKIAELHGSSRKILCLKCERSYDPDEVMKKLVGEFESPKCAACGGILKVGDGVLRPGDAGSADAVGAGVDGAGRSFHRHGLVVAGAAGCVISGHRQTQ